jgi:arginyl-tRNA synthetase
MANNMLNMFNMFNILELKKILEDKLKYKFNITKSLEHGILSTNQAFINSKKYGLTVEEGANKIRQEVDLVISDFYTGLFVVSVVGAYVNIAFTEKGLLKFLNTEYLFSCHKSDKKILLDYVSPNVAKPIHVGHVRNMNLGESIRRLLDFKYTDIITDNHWGDWGVQFGILIYVYKHFRDNPDLKTFVIINDEKISLEFNDYNKKPFETLLNLYIWGSQNKDKILDFDKHVRNEFLKLEQKDNENFELWQDFLNVSKGEIKEDLDRFNVKSFDIEWGESHYEPMLKNIYSFFEKNNLWIKGEGENNKARYIDFANLNFEIEEDQKDKYKKLGFAYLVSKDGYSTYLLRDIAARIAWVDDLGRETMITLTGNEQNHHFEQFFAICDLLSNFNDSANICRNYINLKPVNLKHISYGMLSMKGKAKMSTRNGVVNLAKDFYQEIFEFTKNTLIQRKEDKKNENQVYEINQDKINIITIAAIKWFDLQKDSVHDLSLDISDILSFEGNTGVYQLYTIARINSLVAKNLSSDGVNDIKLLNIQEKEIIFKVLQYPIVLDQAISNLKPHILIHYSFALANDLNSWYNTCSLLQEPDLNRKTTLIYLLRIVREILIKNLDFLAIEHLDQM